MDGKLRTKSPSFNININTSNFSFHSFAIIMRTMKSVYVVIRLSLLRRSFLSPTFVVNENSGRTSIESVNICLQNTTFWNSEWKKKDKNWRYTTMNVKRQWGGIDFVKLKIKIKNYTRDKNSRALYIRYKLRTQYFWGKHMCLCMCRWVGGRMKKYSPSHGCVKLLRLTYLHVSIHFLFLSRWKHSHHRGTQPREIYVAAGIC